MDGKYENRSDEPRRAHVDQNQGTAVIAGFHSETSEPEVVQLLKESISEIGMTIENARIECTAKPITHGFIHFQARSMDAEERFHQKRMEYVKYCLDTEAHISQRPDCGKDMPKRKPKVHQIPRH